MRQVPEAIAERLEAAAAVFADRGFSETRIEDIAEATGVPRATLYYYFAGKEDILAWLLRRTLAAAAEAVAAAIRPRSRPAGQRLAAVVDAQLRVMAEHPDACRALAADAGRVGRIPEIAAAIQNASTGRSAASSPTARPTAASAASPIPRRPRRPSTARSRWPASTSWWPTTTWTPPGCPVRSVRCSSTASGPARR